MFSIQLKTKKVMIDLYALTVQDVRDLQDTKKKPHEGDAILCKAVGMTPAELQALPFPDYRKLTKFFWQCAYDPLKDEDEAKNLESASTLD